MCTYVYVSCMLSFELIFLSQTPDANYSPTENWKRSSRAQSTHAVHSPVQTPCRVQGLQYPPLVQEKQLLT